MPRVTRQSRRPLPWPVVAMTWILRSTGRLRGGQSPWQFLLVFFSGISSSDSSIIVVPAQDNMRSMFYLEGALMRNADLLLGQILDPLPTIKNMGSSSLKRMDFVRTDSFMLY